MRFLIERFLPHLNIALSIALIVIAILNIYNPMMGFLYGTPAFVLICAECLVSFMNAVASYIIWRKERKKNQRR